MKRWLIVLFLILALIPANAVFAQYDYNSPDFKKVINQLDMQGHANDDFATCSVKQLYYEEVVGMLNDGMTADEILQFYVDEYGQAALKEPSKDKSGLIAWGMPIAGVLAGGAIVFVWLRKLRVNHQTVLDNSIEDGWESETEKEIAEKIFDEERRKHF